MNPRNKGLAGFASTMLVAAAVVGPSSFASPGAACQSGNK